MIEISTIPAGAPETGPTSGADEKTRGLSAWIVRLALAAALIAALIFVGRELGGYLEAFKDWVKGVGIWGPVAFIAGYALATVAFAPGSVLTLAAGAIFGIANGTIYVFVGATLGASAAFLVSRHVARGAIEKKMKGHPRFAAVDRAIGEQGRKIVFLLRLSPVFPFNFLNYALGLTKVRFVDYIVASLGMLPGTLLYVYYGKVGGEAIAVAGSGGIEKDAAYYTYMVLGLTATIAVTAVVTRMARRSLKEATSD